MISKKAIESVYRQYNKLPESPDCLDIILLFEGIHPAHCVEINGNELIINSVDDSSPFHKISLDRIYGIVEFEETVGIVLHSSIIFLGKRTPEVNVHLKACEPSIVDRLRSFFSAEA